jgi:hypothetical protein
MDLDPPRVEKKIEECVVMLIDVSGSMNESSGEAIDAPKRIELAVHMAKVMLAFCRKLKLKFFVYTFSDTTSQIPITQGTSVNDANKILERINAEGQTFLGLALKTILQKHGEQSKYFVFTDGQPSTDPTDAILLYNSVQLHMLAFSSAVSTEVLDLVAMSSYHTVSYIQDIRSLPGYMVPIFIWAITNLNKVVLDPINDECRTRFIHALERLMHGDKGEIRSELKNLMLVLHQYQSQYAKDLAVDTSGDLTHSRIEYSFANWKSFGRFYLICIVHCHKNLIPGNAFDPSLKHYRTREYNQVYEQIADIPAQVPFVAFTAPAPHRAVMSQAASQHVQRSFGYQDSYDSSAGSEGCIGPDALISTLTHGIKEIPMKEAKIGDSISDTKIKWIIRIANLNRGNPIPLYNGLTSYHPVQSKETEYTLFIKAKDQKSAVFTTTQDIVYDIILEDPKVHSMKVNGVYAAVVGYPIPGMVHPYWGSSKVLENVSKRYPDGGFVDVDASRFRYDDLGLVSSIFQD